MKVRELRGMLAHLPDEAEVRITLEDEDAPICHWCEQEPRWDVPADFEIHPRLEQTTTADGYWAYLRAWAQ